MWIGDYLKAPKAALDSISVEAVAKVIGRLRACLDEDRQIFVAGMEGAHPTPPISQPTWAKARRTRSGTLSCSLAQRQRELDDSDRKRLQLWGRFRPAKLRQGRRSVNCVDRERQFPERGARGGVGKGKKLHTVALVGGELAAIADEIIVIGSTHYGRVEDAQIGICHKLCYAFMENPRIASRSPSQ